MNDIALFSKEFCFDLGIVNDDLEADDGLETAVAISIFTDRRIEEDDLIQGMKSRKGWWGDMVPEEDGDQIGSRIWTMGRDKANTEALRRSEELHLESLDWMIVDGVSNNITAVASYDKFGQLITIVEIFKPDGTSSKFLSNWDAQELRRI